MRGALARSVGFRRLMGGAVGFEAAFDSLSGVKAALVLDYSGAVGGQFFANGNNTKTFSDLHIYTGASLATQKDTAGLIKFKPHNLFRGSEDADKDQGNVNATVTLNDTAAPDGTTTADKLVMASNGYFYKDTTGSHTASDFFGSLWVRADSAFNIGFRLTAQAGPGTLNAQKTIAVTTSWQRFDLSGTSTGGTVIPEFGVDTRAGSGGDGNAHTVYVWGFQLNKAPMAAANDTFDAVYVPTTSAVVFQHRLDHDKDGNRIGLLIEEARTNKCLQSQVLGTTWTIPGSNTTITDNAATAPDGTTTAEDVKHLDSAETIQQTITVTDNKVHTISAFVKQGTTGSHDWVKMEWMDDSDATNGFEAWFNISTVAVGSTPAATGTGSYTAGSAKIEDYGNSWYRISAAGQIVSGQTDGRIVIINTTADNVETAEATNSVFWWGLVVEEGAFPTSYIPTTTVAVTRAVEDVEVLISAFAYNQSAGSLFVQARASNVTPSAGLCAFFDEGTTSELIRLNLSASHQHRGFIRTQVSGVTFDTPGGSTTYTLNSSTKIAFGFASDDAILVVAGVIEHTDAVSVTLPAAIDKLAVGSLNNAGTPTEWSNGHIESLAYYSSRLTNADLQGIST